MKISDKGLEFLCKFEKFEADAYWDKIGKVWTIGYGSTKYPDGSPVRKGEVCTKEQAMAYCLAHLEKDYKYIYKAFDGYDLKQQWFDAICCMVYNCGPHYCLNYKWARNLKALIESIANGKSQKIIDHYKVAIITSWMSVDGGANGSSYNAGLERRRFGEMYYFITGDVKYMVADTWDEEKKLMNGNYEAKTEGALWKAWGLI